MLPEFSYARPSEVIDVPFVYAVRREQDYPEPTERSGKWLVFVSPQEVDTWWALIKKATIKGLLGSSSKVSTKWPNPRLRPPHKTRAICIYTYDFQDLNDVMRVRRSLRDVGVYWPIPYRAESDICVNACRGKGPTAFDRYFE